MAFFPGHPADLPHRHQAAEYCRVQRGWFQDGRKLHAKKVKQHRALVWPKDGRNGSKWGRFKDVLKNRGPDMYMTLSADKLDVMQNRPTRAQWAGYSDLEDDEIMGLPFHSQNNAWWTKYGAAGGRAPGLSYDFRTRQYVPRYHRNGEPRRLWTDAVWQPEQYSDKRYPFPEAMRDIDGQWWQRDVYLPQSRAYRVPHVLNRRGAGGPGWERYPYPDVLYSI